MTGPGNRKDGPRPWPTPNRDEEIEAFFAAHHRSVRGLLIACGCEDHEADDVVQDTLLVIREKYWERVRTLDKPVAYWCKIALRRYWRLQAARARWFAAGDHHELLVAVADPVDATENVDRKHALMALIRQLPPRQRQVVWLREVVGLREAETAKILAIQPGTVKSHLHDGKARLEELLRKDDETWKGEIR